MHEWYSLSLPAPLKGNLKSNEFGVFVRKDYVPLDASSEDVSHFRAQVERNMSDLKEVLDLPRVDVLWTDKLPGGLWLHGVEIGPCGLFLSDSYTPSRSNFDPKKDAAYFSHNCDYVGHRGVLLTLFNQWTEMMDTYKQIRAGI